LLRRPLFCAQQTKRVSPGRVARKRLCADVVANGLSGALKVSPQQMRAAIESLPYENPKLSAMAVTSMSANDFARALDRCIERSSKAKLIELKPTSIS
jgi:hypothetical protein